MIDLGAPSSYLSLQKGMPVLSRQGTQVGTVHVVVADHGADVFDALVVEKSGGLRVALAEEVDSIYERGVVLALGTQACSRLRKPQPVAVEPTRDGETSRLRRAWELISGGS